MPLLPNNKELKSTNTDTSDSPEDLDSSVLSLDDAGREAEEFALNLNY